MKRRRDDQRELRNRRWKQFLRRLQEQEWERQRHIWRMGSKVFSEDLEPDEDMDEKQHFTERF